MIAVIVSGMRMIVATMIMSMVTMETYFSTAMRPRVSMAMQKSMATSDNNRHKQVACRESQSQMSPQHGHSTHQRGVEDLF
jgi:hypothetical protein